MIKDMTVGSPGKTLFFFALPMVAGNLFQQLYNIVDSIVVGNFVGEKAFAAVGVTTTFTFLFVALAAGLSVGASVIISQYFGARRYREMKTAVGTILISILVLSSFLLVIGSVTCGEILKLLNTPDDILLDAVTYLRIYFFGLVFLFSYNMLNAIFNGIGDSRTPLVFLVFSSLLNIGLDLLFVIQFSMGVAGVAYATLISQGLSAVLSLCVLLFRLKKIKIGERAKLYDWRILKSVCRIAVPSTIQQSIVSIGSLLVQVLVNSYGSVVVAGYTAAIKIDGIAIMPMINVGNAISNFTAQNIGGKRPERVARGLRAGFVMSAVIALAVTLVMFLYGDVFVGMFLPAGANPEIIKVGTDYLKVVSVFYLLMGAMNLFNGVLRGAGDVKVFMTATLCNFGARVILAFVLARFIGFQAVWWAIPIGWLIGLVITSSRYISGRWKEQSLI